MTVSLDDQIACALRESSMRARVYPRFIASGKMSVEQARREQIAMQAITATLQQVRLAQRARRADGWTWLGWMPTVTET
jgi:hypothetical protein